MRLSETKHIISFDYQGDVANKLLLVVGLAGGTVCDASNNYGLSPL